MGFDKQILIDNAVIKADEAILSAEFNLENGFYQPVKIDYIMQFFIL